jgi:hypothetical protein
MYVKYVCSFERMTENLLPLTLPDQSMMDGYQVGCYLHEARLNTVSRYLHESLTITVPIISEIFEWNELCLRYFYEKND